MDFGMPCPELSTCNEILLKELKNFVPLLLFRWFCRKEYHRDIEGDLLELYELNATERGSAKAKWTLTREVLLLFRSGIVKGAKKRQQLNTTDMVKHTIKFSFRSYMRYKSSFFINLIGLSTGLACSFLIYLWVQDEKRIDHFHEQGERIYQVLTNEDTPSGIYTGEATPHLLADALVEEIPGLSRSISFSPLPNELIFTLEDQKMRASGHFASPDFFEMFTYPLVQGNPATVLSDKANITISEQLAMKLFNGLDNVLGQTLKWNLQGFESQGTITGIFQKPGNNSTHQFDYLIHFEQFEDLVRTYVGELTWETLQPFTYVMLEEGQNPETLSQQIRDFIQKKTGNDSPDLFLASFENRYLYGKYQNGEQTGGRIEYVRIFIIIAAFILVVACINFMNLSTARASRRLKEIGVKKAIGAGRRSLIFQFLSESVLLSLISTLLAIVLVNAVLPGFNRITGKSVFLHWDLQLIMVLSGITLLTGLMAGSYPALMLSAMPSVEILKGKMRNSLKAAMARKGLVIFQFTVSVVLIVSVTVIYKQVEYVQSKNLGYNKEALVSFPKEGRVASELDLFLNQARALPGVQHISAISNNMTRSATTIGQLNWEGKSPDMDVLFQFIALEYGMLETLGVEMVAGRSFSKDFATDDTKVIINQTALALMEMETPIGEFMDVSGQKMEIIGVTQDFHFESLHEVVDPAIMVILPQWTYNVMMRLQPGNHRETLESFSAFFKEFNDGLSPDLKFVDDSYNALYKSEQQVSVLSRYFAGFAILISCLGLLGLVAFTAERKRKEISIRKVLGCGVGRIMYMLSTDFISTLIYAMIVALPVSYFITKSWLDGFEYRINLQWWFFAGAGGLVLLIAWFTVSLQVFRAARVNPVMNLKDD